MNKLKLLSNQISKVLTIALILFAYSPSCTLSSSKSSTKPLDQEVKKIEANSSKAQRPVESNVKGTTSRENAENNGSQKKVKQDSSGSLSGRRSFLDFFRSAKPVQATTSSTDSTSHTRSGISGTNAAIQKDVKLKTSTNAAQTFNKTQVTKTPGSAVSSSTLQKKEDKPVVYETTKTIETTESFKPKVSGE